MGKWRGLGGCGREGEKNYQCHVIAGTPNGCELKHPIESPTLTRRCTVKQGAMPRIDLVPVFDPSTSIEDQK